MKDYLLDLKFYRIINGYFEIFIKDQKYKVIYPSLQKKYDAEKLYVSLMQDSRFDTEYLDSSQLDRILRQNGIWSNEQQEKFDKIEKEIDKLKIRLFQNYKNEEIRQQAKDELKVLREYHHELFSQKHSLDYLTLDFFASNIKNQYLISQCILTVNDQQVFSTDYYEIDLDLLKIIVTETQKNQISAEDLRQICRGDTWKRYVCQENIFGPTIYLNDDQINLLSLQRMYDNVRQHPECPDEKIIEDQDALDGWFLHQREQNKKNKKKNEALNKIRGKVGGHDFVYMITHDAEEATAIEDMNDLRGRQLVSSVRETSSKLKEGESIKWGEIPYIKQEIKSQAYRNQKQGVPQ